ncbi:hypothetical protein EV359DRAFT_66718 [Lentinula novae-zelandiae]|nr:hypothetical protein EV359DRAFT_66718 [Lentinula novae-zelandiae]
MASSITFRESVHAYKLRKQSQAGRELGKQILQLVDMDQGGATRDSAWTSCGSFIVAASSILMSVQMSGFALCASTGLLEAVWSKGYMFIDHLCSSWLAVVVIRENKLDVGHSIPIFHSELEIAFTTEIPKNILCLWYDIRVQCLMYLQMYIPPLSFYMPSVKGKAERSSYIIVIQLFYSGKKSVDISFTINTTFELLEHLQSSSAMHERFAYNARNDPPNPLAMLLLRHSLTFSPQTPNEIHESYLVIYVLSDLVPKKEVLSKFGKPLQHCLSGVPMKPISSTDN